MKLSEIRALAEYLLGTIYNDFPNTFEQEIMITKATLKLCDLVRDLHTRDPMFSFDGSPRNYVDHRATELGITIDSEGEK
jgi:hypothetical protein